MARDAIAVLNAGSSSLKFALFLLRPGRDRMRRDPVPLLRGQIEGIGRTPSMRAFGVRAVALEGPSSRSLAERARTHADALALLLDWFEEERAGLTIVAAGHRVVHGGVQYDTPRMVDAEVLGQLSAIKSLAPHHLPHNIAAIEAMAERRPGVPQIACFDTAFHTTQPAVATRLPLPRTLAERGVRRYGFHGLSYEYVTGALASPSYLGALPRRTVIAHLGNGASMCALQDGRSIATTMGFSTLDGLMMGTRSGTLDPGVLLYLMREDGADEIALGDMLYNRSGLRGVSGLSGDMRVLLASDQPEAKEAIDLYCYRAVREVGSLAAALGGLDALVFTGGVGENAAPIRARVCAGCRWLGLDLDDAANIRNGPRISKVTSAVAAWVVPTNEELVIARHARNLLLA